MRFYYCVIVILYFITLAISGAESFSTFSRGILLNFENKGFFGFSSTKLLIILKINFQLSPNLILKTRRYYQLNL